MPLIRLYSCFITFFQYALDESLCIDKRFNGIGSFPSIEGYLIYEAALIKETGSIQTFSRTSFRTDIRSATQVENTSKNAGQTLSLRAPSK